MAIWRKERYYSVRNAYEVIHKYCDDPNGIVLNVDADDWLAGPKAVATLVKHYREQRCLFSYGDCFIWSGDDNHMTLASETMPFCNVPYSNPVRKQNAFRNVPFVVLHPRSWKVKAFKKIPKDAFLRRDGSWLQFCEDQAIFFPLLEMFPKLYSVCDTPLSVYNQENAAADIKMYRLETLRDEIEIRRKQKYAPLDL